MMKQTRQLQEARRRLQHIVTEQKGLVADQQRVIARLTRQLAREQGRAAQCLDELQRMRRGLGLYFAGLANQDSDDPPS